jgi:exonuclease VII large subunit
LSRGYSIVTREGQGEPLADPEGLKSGDRLAIRFARGSVLALVEEVLPDSATGKRLDG